MRVLCLIVVLLLTGCSATPTSTVTAPTTMPAHASAKTLEIQGMHFVASLVEYPRLKEATHDELIYGLNPVVLAGLSDNKLVLLKAPIVPESLLFHRSSILAENSLRTAIESTTGGTVVLISARSQDGQYEMDVFCAGQSEVDAAAQVKWSVSLWRPL